MIEKISDAKCNKNIYFIKQIIQNGGNTFLTFVERLHDYSKLTFVTCKINGDARSMTILRIGRDWESLEGLKVWHPRGAVNQKTAFILNFVYFATKNEIKEISEKFNLGTTVYNGTPD